MATYAGYREGGVAFEGAAPAEYASSPGVRRLFCRTCGTPLAYRGERWPGEVHLFVATFDAPGDLPPRAHVNVGEKLPWVQLADGLRQFQTTGDGTPPDNAPAAS
jgi:hypothetical protein